jgi:hypothetical protein
MEQRPELRYALHVSPTAVTVAAERICCMRVSDSLSFGDEVKVTQHRVRAGIATSCLNLNAQSKRIEKMMHLLKVTESVLFEFVLCRIRYRHCIL